MISTNFEQIISVIPPTTADIILGVLLGLFIGLEREWSNKPAGIRTFALTATVGVVFAIVNDSLLMVSGVLFVLVLAILLGYSGIKSVRDDSDIDTLQDESYGLALTTSVSLLVTYSVGILIGLNYYSAAITIAVLSSSLLALKRELHSFAWGLSRNEMRSAIEFAIIAFVIYPVLPSEAIDPWGVVDLQLVWLLVIAISTIGFINYILAKRYQERSFLLTGFLGGLVNSTAVIVSVARHVKENPQLQPLIIGSILLANGAMAIRNAVIVLVFYPTAGLSILPLITIAISSVGMTFYLSTADDKGLENELSSPFSLKNALTFGGLFIIVLLLSGMMEQMFGSIGFMMTAFFSGLVSSGTTTTTAITLFSKNTISASTLTFSVLIGTIASILVKILFAAKINRKLIKPVTIYNGILVFIGVATAFGVTIV